MRYVERLLTLNNTTFDSAIYSTEYEIHVSYLDILVTIENVKYSTALYDKRDNSNLCIVNFPCISSITSGPAYKVYLSHLVCIGRICSKYS